jgi:hypothetical protein
MDDERLKRGGFVLSDRYFEEQFQRVREIRQEPKFYVDVAKKHLTDSELAQLKHRIVQDRLFESDFDRVVAKTKRLGEGAAKGTTRKGKKP